MAKRFLTDAQERDLIVFYLCRMDNVSALEYIRVQWGMGVDNVVGPMMARVKEKNYPLVKFYYRKSQQKRYLNALHFYMAYHGIDVENRELVTSDDDNIYFHLDMQVYRPLMETAVKNSGFMEYQIPANPLESLLLHIRSPSPVLIGPAFDAVVREAYDDRIWPRDFDYLLESEVRRRVKSGCLSITGIKADAVNEIIDGLPEKEGYVIRSIYGIDTEPLNTREIAESLGISKKKAVTLQNSACSLLRAHSDLIENVLSLSTDEEFHGYLAEKRE